MGAANGALAIAVYADAEDRLLVATDRGYEGVACVDDAARALVLFCDLWTATRLPLARSWARGLLQFVLDMEDREGRFVNFITDWSGTRNGHGPTSFAGGSFWHARAVRGLARAAIALGDERALLAARRGMTHLRGIPAPADVRAIHICAAVDLLRVGGAPELRTALEVWASELVACRRDDVLYDNPDQSEPHLWAHIQEAALIDAGVLLARDDLIDVARRSVVRFIAPLIESGFDLPTMQPYGVACALAGVERLAAVAPDARLARLADQARAWFNERNPAGRAVYDRVAGRVHDGIDAGILNRHSGAESNIAAAEALFSELPAIAAAYREDLETNVRNVAA